MGFFSMSLINISVKFQTVTFHFPVLEFSCSDVLVPSTRWHIYLGSLLFSKG